MNKWCFIATNIDGEEFKCIFDCKDDAVKFAQEYIKNHQEGGYTIKVREVNSHEERNY